MALPRVQETDCGCGRALYYYFYACALVQWKRTGSWAGGSKHFRVSFLKTI